MADYPALPLFTDAYLADTRHLTPAQHGAYLLMLMCAWRAPDCMLPKDDVYLSRITGMDKRTWAANRDVLLAFWTEVTEANLQGASQTKLFQKRLKEQRKFVEDKRNKNSASGQASALKRKNTGSTNVGTNPQPETNHTISITKEEDRYNQESTSHSVPDSARGGAPPSRDVSDFQQVFDAGCELFPRLVTSNASMIHGWLRAGCDVGLDILPEIRRLHAAGKDIGAWSYFTEGVMRAKASREATPATPQIASPAGKVAEKPLQSAYSGKTRDEMLASAQRANERLQALQTGRKMPA